MPVAALIAGFIIKSLIAYAVVRVLVALGLSYVVYQGMDTLLNNLEAEVQANYASLGVVLDMMNMFGVDVAFSIIFSAMTLKLILKGWLVPAFATMRLTQGFPGM